MEDEFIDVKNGTPKDCNDCIVKFDDGSFGVAYYGGGGSSLWAKGIGLPLDKVVISWKSTGNCDSVKNYDKKWKG